VSAPALVTELDVTRPEVIADPYPFFAQARAKGAVQWHEGMGMWLCFTHKTSNAVLRARTLGRIWTPRWPEEDLPAFALIHVHSLLENEPPTHTRLRRLIASAFGRGHVERLRPRITEMAGALADDLVGDEVELISQYAEPLPVQVIAELLGVPRVDWPLLRPWSNAIVKMYEYAVTPSQRVAAETASREFVEYLRELVVFRRTQPGDDLISSLIAETDGDGARLSEDELVTTCTLLLNAGHEATVNVVGNGVLALLRNPEQLARLRADPSLIPSAVEELIRYDSPLQLFERTALSDTVIGDVTVRAGQKVAALLGAAGRDPAVFDQPDVLDIGRVENPHLGFGAGIHFCVGAPLARVELQVSLQTLLARAPSLELAGVAERRPEFVIRGLRALPVRLGESS
jgi:cytochrome P450